MDTKTIQAIANNLQAEPDAVIREISPSNDLLDSFVIVQYKGRVFKMGQFYLPSDAQKYAVSKAEEQPTWTVVLVRKFPSGIEVNLVTPFGTITKR